MAELANVRHERFAQLVVSGRPQDAAHAEAGFSGSPAAHASNASRLIRSDKVAARIAELNAAALAALSESAEEAVATAAWIIQKSVDVVEIGLATVPVRDRNGKVISRTETAENGLEVEVPEFYEAHNLTAANGALKLLSARFPGVFAPEGSAGDRSQHLHLHGLSEPELRALASAFRA